MIEEEPRPEPTGSAATEAAGPSPDRDRATAPDADAVASPGADRTARAVDTSAEGPELTSAAGSDKATAAAVDTPAPGLDPTFAAAPAEAAAPAVDISTDADLTPAASDLAPAAESDRAAADLAPAAESDRAAAAEPESDMSATPASGPAATPESDSVAEPAGGAAADPAESDSTPEPSTWADTPAPAPGEVDTTDLGSETTGDPARDSDLAAAPSAREAGTTGISAPAVPSADDTPAPPAEPAAEVTAVPDAGDGLGVPATESTPDAGPTSDVTADQATDDETAAQPAGPETAADPGAAAPTGVAAAQDSPAATENPAPPAGGGRPDRGDRSSRASRPGPGRPGPGRARPGRPGAPAPSGAAAPGSPHLPVAVEPIVEPIDPHKWGRIDESGAVFVYSTAGERQVGNWQAGDVEAGLAHYGRRYDDFVTEIALLETRLATGSGDAKATRAHAVELREAVDTLAAVGDLDSAAARLEVVIGAAEAAVAGASQARIAARARAVAAKEALCAEAEALAESTQWKATGDRLKEIVDVWRTIHGIDRKTDDALWKRFAKARDTFTKHRGSHFADLDKQRGAAREAKEKLIARAEELAQSSEWGKTAGEYRQLMEEWKASGRAPREVEDQLWERFRAAQESFFSRRNTTFSQRDKEFDANAAAKEKLLAEAERIDPAKGLEAARSALRSVQERWEAVGKVPRERIREFDTRLRSIEDRVKRAEDSHWRRTDPETAARVEQFRTRAQAFRAQAAKARAAGDERRAVQAEAQAKQWEEWLATAEGAR